MQFFENFDSNCFLFNGLKYVKNFVVLPVGSDAVAVYNAFDTRMQLLPATHYSQIKINSASMPSQEVLMSALVPMLFAKQIVSEGELKDEIISIGEITQDGNEITIPELAVWRIGGITLSNEDEFVTTIAAATTGETRIDIIVAKADSTFELIMGEPSEDVAVAPVVPNNALLVTSITILGEYIIIGGDTTIGNIYIRKDDFNETFVGAYANYPELPIDAKRSVLRFIGGCAELGSFTFSNLPALYNGKRLIIKNFQSIPLTIKHNGGTGIYKFYFPNEQDFVLQPKQIIDFTYSATLKKFEFIGSLNEDAPDLQDVLDEGNTAYGNSIFLKQSPSSDSSIDINVDDFSESFIKVKNGSAGASGYATILGSNSLIFDGEGDHYTTLRKVSLGSSDPNLLDLPQESGILATREWFTGNTPNLQSVLEAGNSSDYGFTLSNFGTTMTADLDQGYLNIAHGQSQSFYQYNGFGLFNSENQNRLEIINDGSDPAYVRFTDTSGGINQGLFLMFETPYIAENRSLTFPFEDGTIATRDWVTSNVLQDLQTVTEAGNFTDLPLIVANTAGNTMYYDKDEIWHIDDSQAGSQKIQFDTMLTDEVVKVRNSSGYLATEAFVANSVASSISGLTDSTVTGGTFSLSGKTLTLTKNLGSPVVITGVTEVRQFISSGATTTAPSEQVVYNALDKKANKKSFIAASTGNTLASGTALRPMFTTPANGALPVEANSLYSFECVFAATGASGSNIVQFGLGGTATITNIGYSAVFTRAAGYSSVVTQYTTYNNVATAANLNSSSTGGANQGILKGTFTTGSAGTIVPSIGFAISASVTIEAGSIFSMERLGDSINLYSSDAS